MKPTRWRYVDTFADMNLEKSIELAHYYGLDKFYLNNKKYILFDGRYREVVE